MNGKAYGILGEEKLNLARQMGAEMRGKTTAESLDIILKFMPRITAGKPFTAEEKAEVINALKEDMNDTEKMKLKEILAVIGMK